MTNWRDIPGNPQAFDELAKLVKSGKGIGFVGAGASAGLYPLWSELIEQLADAAVAAGKAEESFKRTWCTTEDALQAARQIRKRLEPGPFNEQIRRIFGPKKGTDGKRFTKTHAALVRLTLHAFVTTNYDPALTYACLEHRPGRRVLDFDGRHDRVGLWLQDQFADEGELAILHAHGQFDGAEGLVLDAEDYRRAYGGDRYRALFEQLWTRERLVVVGFGFRDPWLRIVVDEALSRAGSRKAGDRRHLALIALPSDEVGSVELHREEIEDTYHCRPLFYPVKDHDHSVLGQVLDELLDATSTTTAPAAPTTTATAPSGPDPLDVWFEQVAAEHRRLGDHFDRPVELHLLEQAWVQVKVRPAVEGQMLREGRGPEGGGERKEALFGHAATLDEVLSYPVGEPNWNVGRWLLEGPPGSGKTTLLRHLAARLAKQQARDMVPLFVSLPRLVDAEQEILQHATDGLALAGGETVRDALATAGREGRLLILLDGFDEVRRERRASVRRLLAQLAREQAWSSCKVVVSSRPIGRGAALDDLPRLDLLPLDAGRREEFLEKWFRHAGRGDGKTEAAEALAHFTSSSGLEKLSGIPLYLTLLAVLWEQGERPPSRLAKLYDEIFELLLDGRHKRDGEPMPEQEGVREALRHLAYGMTEDDLWAEPVKRLESRLRANEGVRQSLATVDAWRNSLYTFLHDVQERTQILGPHDGGAVDAVEDGTSTAAQRRGDWRFWHRTFREALTAERLLRQHEKSGGGALVEWARQLDEGGESRWAEPMALLAGRLENADDLVLRLGDANPKLAIRAAAFAQGLASETVRKLLQLTEDLDERSQAFESIPDQLDDADACLALVDQLREGNRNGFDLYWLWWIVEEVERRWPVGDRCRDLLARFFEHIPTPKDSELLRSVETPLDGRTNLWRKIPEGEGCVGSPEDEEGRDNDEGPRHRVEIVRPYWLGSVPVTNAQYAAFDPDKAPYEEAGVTAGQLLTHPRVEVTWYEAVSFCRWLSTLPGFEGCSPRLPIEEEWEVACRAGSETRFWMGNDDKDLDATGWFVRNSGNRTHRVGSKPANEFGLYDVHGNVWEWTSSPWQGERYAGREGRVHPVDPAAQSADLAEGPRANRVVRGGSWWSSAQGCRSAYRNFRVPRDEFRDLGFRVLLSSAPSGLR